MVQSKGLTDGDCSELGIRLRSLGFHIAENVKYRGQMFALVAKRTKFEVEKFGFVETFLVYTRFSQLDMVSLRQFSDAGFAYAPQASKIPLPRGFLKCIVCYTVAAVEGTDPALTNAVRSTEPPRHWSACQIPVVHDLATQHVHCLEKTPYWGSMYWDQFRDTIRALLSPETQT